MSVVTRFAPSPTGRLHVGNIRTALLNWLWARREGGRFLLRLDDTDRARSTDAFAQAIRDDLAWLGLEPDGEARQTDRFALYEARFEALRESGRVYACYETPEELELRRRVLLGRGLPPIYERPQGDATVPADRAAHWRFRLDHDAPIVWHDLIRGPQRFDPALLSDPVVRREDGSWLYLLPSAIDDVELGITDIVRGEDHVTNTAAQLQMFAALGAAPPRVAHAALLVGGEGKLSKRLGATGVDDFRAAGIEPIALLAKLARIGTSLPVDAVTDAAPLVAGFDFASFGRAPARFDEAELAALNARTVHALSFAAVARRLPDGMDERAWLAVRGNLERVSEADQWWRIVAGDIERPEVDDADYLREAARVAGEIEWAHDPWHALTSALKASTGRRGKPLFMPLRLALTGRDHGPEMAALLPLIGRERAIARLRR